MWICYRFFAKKHNDSYESFYLVMCLWILLSYHNDNFPDHSKTFIIELSIEKDQKVCTYNLVFSHYWKIFQGFP